MDTDPLIVDVCAASAAYLWDVLPEIMKLPPPEAFARLAVVLQTMFLAYFDAAGGWLPEPPGN